MNKTVNMVLVNEINTQITTNKFLLTFIMKISHLSNSSQGSHRLRVASVWAAIGERVNSYLKHCTHNFQKNP